MILTW